MATRFLKISSNGNKILKSKMIAAPSITIIFNFSFPFSIDYLALGQNYVIIGKANGGKDVTFYECIHWSPLENKLPKFLGMRIELHPDLYKILSKA